MLAGRGAVGGERAEVTGGVWGCLPTSRPWPSHQLTSATGPAAVQFMQPGVRLAEGAVGSS